MDGAANPCESASTFQGARHSPDRVGQFRRDAVGYLLSEGGAEPTDAPRKRGEMLRFDNRDTDNGAPYVIAAGGVYYRASDVDLRGCRLKPVPPPR